MRAVLLLNDDDHVAVWFRNALKKAIDDGLEIGLVIHCTNTPAMTIHRRTLAYYGFAFLSRWRFKSMKSTTITDLIPASVPRVSFAAEQEGAWQRIPSDVVAELNGFDVMIKSGMSLLRGADELPLRYGTLSFHHGDPEHYRGRPAGYYEVYDGAAVQGIMVQAIGDRLDGGKVIALAHTRVVPHSYGQTLNGAYVASEPMLAKALDNLRRNDLPDQPLSLGPNYRLPTSGHVTKQCGRLFWRRLKRGMYGAVIDKKWDVCTVTGEISLVGETRIDESQLEALPVPSGYRFLADPMSSTEGDLFVEALSARTGLGAILKRQDEKWQKVETGLTGHMSYPQVIEHEEGTYLFPEMASIGSPTLFELDESRSRTLRTEPMRGLEGERIIDGTLHSDGNHWYLFGGRQATGSSQLLLWVSDELFGRYQEHPASPICMDPRGARMAGPLLRRDGDLYRLGQDCSRTYGDGIRAHRIELLTPYEYKESATATISCRTGKGPHTLGSFRGGFVIDRFEERFTLLAGPRRLLAALVARTRTDS